jgi:hypothetical protein
LAQDPTNPAGRDCVYNERRRLQSVTTEGGKKSEQTSVHWISHWCQSLLRCRRPIHASRTARPCTDQPDNSGCWWLWPWLSPRPIWRLPSQRLLRWRVLRRRGCSARRGRSGSSSGRRLVPSRLQRLSMLGRLLTDLNYQICGKRLRNVSGAGKRMTHACCVAPWSKAEEKQCQKGIQIANERKRSPLAIELRLQRLGIIPPS